MSVRWTCPNGCAAVLAPTKPRRNDVRRYCLPCSAKSGRLVERVAPSLERDRAERADAKACAAKAALVRETAYAAARFTVGGVDLRTIVAEAWRLPISREWRERRGLQKAPPSLTVRRNTGGYSRAGFARPWAHTISVTVYVGRAWVHDPITGIGAWSGPPNVPKVPLATLLHEVAHILVGKDRAQKWHGPKFKTCLARLVEDYRAEFPNLNGVEIDRELGPLGERDSVDEDDHEAQSRSKHRPAVAASPAPPGAAK